MKTLLASVFFLISSLFFAQQTSDTDIFEVNKESVMVLRPEIEKNIQAKIEPAVKKKLQVYKETLKKNEDFLYDENQFASELAFAQDTLRIHEFLKEFNRYEEASTTYGINWQSSYKLEAYDKLLNKYYQKALTLLQADMKKKLINSQRKWLDYYLKERLFIYDLNDFGNQNVSMWCDGYYLDMLENRVYFLKDICAHQMNGDHTYK